MNCEDLDQTIDAQADLSLCWVYMSEDMFSHSSLTLRNTII